MKTIPWSYSSLLNHEMCPLRTKFDKIDRIPNSPESEEFFADGIEKHQQMEDYLVALKDNPKTKLPTCATKIKDHMKKVLEEYPLEKTFPEHKYAFKKDFEPTDDYYDKEIWSRSVLDLVAISEDNTKGRVVDYKSGKFNPYASIRNLGQLQLYAVVLFVNHPELQQISSSIFYMRDGKETNKIFHRKKLPFYMASFIERGNKMFYATEFTQKPSKSNCKFCNHSQSKHCEYRFES